jgi:hypothetical protein
VQPLWKKIWRLLKNLIINLPFIQQSLFLTQLAKMLCLPYYAYVFSSTRLVIRAEQDLPGTEGCGGRSGKGE